MQRPKPGDYFRRHWYGIAIYGYAMTLEEIEGVERQHGAGGEELAFTLRTLERQMAQGFVWGKAYSVACPDGEYGLTPVRAATKISKEEFENAQSAHWEI